MRGLIKPFESDLMLVAYLVAVALILVTEYYEVLWIAWEHTALSNPSKHNSWQNSEQKQTHVKI